MVRDESKVLTHPTHAFQRSILPQDLEYFSDVCSSGSHSVHLIVGRCSAMAAYFVQLSMSDKVIEYDEEDEESEKAALISSVK